MISPEDRKNWLQNAVNQLTVIWQVNRLWAIIRTYTGGKNLEDLSAEEFASIESWVKSQLQNMEKRETIEQND